MTISKGIDLGRVGLSKSLMTQPCERKGAYSELVRDASGRRIRSALPERVWFGVAVDEAHAYIVESIRDGKTWTIGAALAVGTAAVTDKEWAEEPDWETFGIQLENALNLFRSSSDGLARLKPYIEGIRIQGDNGKSLAVDDVIGTPDYLLADGSVLDVKTSGRIYSASKFVESAEMPIYAYLAASESGVLPPRLVYQVYVRVTRPYWQWLEVPGTAAHVALGRWHAAHWRKGLALGDVDLFAVDLAFCKDCPFSVPIPEVGFAGCEVGMARREATVEKEEPLWVA